MSYARGFGQNGGHYYSNVTQPGIINCNFIVDSANGNGLGIRSLKSNGYIENVFMNTSAAFTGTYNDSVNITSIVQGTGSLAVGMPVQGTGIPLGARIASIVSSSAITITAATTGGAEAGVQVTYQGVGANGLISPNPGAGYLLVQFKNNFRYYLGGFSGFVSYVQTSTKIDNSVLTIGQAYVISTLGNSSLADWQSIGLPQGIVPASGVSFIATAVGVPGEANTSTSRVMLPRPSGVASLEVIGDPNSMNTTAIAPYAGKIILAQFLAPSFAGTALGNHTHTLNLKNGAVSDGATTRVNAGTNLLGANTGSDITIAGAGANGGIANASAGTPAGTMSMVAAAPVDGAVCGMSFFFDLSSSTIDGL